MGYAVPREMLAHDTALKREVVRGQSGEERRRWAHKSMKCPLDELD